MQFVKAVSFRKPAVSHRLVISAVALSGACWGACGSGSATIRDAHVAGQTSRQILIAFTAPHANAARVDVFSDAACTKEVPDTVGGNGIANRIGSVVDGAVSDGTRDGSSVTFPAGTLIDNRALAQATQYWIQIKNAADNSAVTLAASTAPFPVGNLYPEQPLPDSTKWDNRSYPRFQWGTGRRNDKYIDPTTGLIAKPFTMPGDAWSQAIGSNDGYNNSPPMETLSTTSGTWNNPANAASTYNVNNYPTAPSGGYATCTGNCDIWLPIPTILPPYSSWDAQTRSVYGPGQSLDYFTPYVWAFANGSAPVMTVSLTQTPTGAPYHGCSFSTAALSPAKTGYRAADPDPGFVSWCATPPLRGDIATSTGTVNTNGTAVTLANGQYFQWSWPAGSFVKIGTSYYAIASVNSPTSLTLQTSAGTQNGVAYASRILGIRIQANAGAGTLSVQAGYRFGISPALQVGEDPGQMHCFPKANTISNDASGLSYAGYTLQGYVCWIQYDPVSNGVYYLVIPKDQNGAPLGEVRLLGTSVSFRTFTSNGVTFTGNNFYYAGPDPKDPNKWYVICSYSAAQKTCVGGSGDSQLLLSAKFDSTLPGCSPLWRTWAGGQSYPFNGNNYGYDSCISYTNLTNPSARPSMDIGAQVVRAYAAANPGFDIGGFRLGAVTYLDGYFGACLGSGGDPQLQICGVFDARGVLTQVFDTFTTFPARFCSVHGPLHMAGTLHSMTCGFTGGPNPNVPLFGPWQFQGTKINLAGFGATANWTTNTALDNGTVNQYACPTSAQMQALGTKKSMADLLVGLGSAGNHCIQIETNTEACSANPNTSALWSGKTKTEAQQFPCPTNPAYSMIQTMQPGDHFMIDGVYGEGFIILTKQIMSPGGVCTAGPGNCVIDMWVIRGSGVWASGSHTSYSKINSHASGWTATMAELQLQGCGAIFGDSTTVGTHTWIEGEYSLCLSHGASAEGSEPSTLNFAFVDTNTYNTFDVAQNADQSRAAMPAWGPGCDLCRSPLYPAFGQNQISMSNGYLIQLYGDASDISNPNQRVALFERHLNPSFGSGGETAAGMGTMGYSLTLVNGKVQTYTLTDPYSAGPANQKLTPLAGFAGAHMLADYSGVASVLPDTGYGMCRALQANECVSGSIAGTTYVSVPAAAGTTQGISGQHTQNAPVVINASSAIGQMQQVSYSKTDPDGMHQRMLGQVFTGLGRQWQFNGPKYLPTGDWYLATMVLRDGFTTIVGLFQSPPYQEDGRNRTGYMQQAVVDQGPSSDQIRVEFWYQEWNGVNGRAEHAFTSPNPTATNPFLWAYETPSYTSCASGCKVSVPAISGHLLYYSVHRKSNNGETTEQVQVVAVP